MDLILFSVGNPITKSSTEMEQHVFQKARTREEYLALVARVILHVRDIKNKTDGKFGSAAGQPVQTAVPSQSPIDALSRLTSTGPGSNPQMQPGMPGGPMMTGPMQLGPHQTFQTCNRVMSQPHPQQVQHGMGSRMVPGTMPGTQTEFIQQMPIGMQQPQQQQPPFSVGMSQQQSVPGQMNTVVTGDSLAGSPHCFQQNTPSGLNHSVAITPSPVGNAQQRGQLQPQMVSQSMSQPSNSMPGSEPSTVSSLGMAHSPVTMIAVPSPSSVQPNIAQSPASRSFTGAPSPGTGLSGPSSIGAAASPASQMSGNEEQAYLAKWKQLQIYIEPLKRMINRMAKDEDPKNMNKMKNLLDILSDSSKRVSMNALLKCEQVLRQMDSKPVPDPLPTKAADAHMCQTLLDAVVSQIKSPMLNHTLHRTFGPAVQALHGPPLRIPSPPPKQIRLDDDPKDSSDIPNLLQGEVARLDVRFRVTLHQLHHAGSRSIRLMCYLNDKNLPNVPPISVTIPEDYPQSSPICDPDLEDYKSTPFLEKVQKMLQVQLLQLPDKHALTSFLNCWEMSIRRACSPASV